MITIHHFREISPLKSQQRLPGSPKYRRWTKALRDGDDDASERRCWLRAPSGFRGAESFIAFERWEAAEVTTADAFPGWMRPLNACGVEAGSVKIQRKSADHGYFEHGVERSDRDVRSDGADHCLADRYLIVSQVAGQSAMTQIDRVVHLSVGDVAFVDAARPVDISLPSMRISRRGSTSGYGFSPPAYAAQDNGDGAACARIGKSACSARDVQFRTS